MSESRTNVKNSMNEMTPSKPITAILLFIRSFPNSRAEMTSRLINLSECALSVAFLYGINLYFSINGNINDPVVPIWWPVTKDAFFLLVFCLIFIGLRGHLPRSSVPLALVIVFSLTCTALSISSFGYSKKFYPSARTSCCTLRAVQLSEH